MNLKESFRYQKFLDMLMQMSQNSIISHQHALKITKHHLRNQANPEAKDKVEEVETGDFIDNDTVLAFMLFLVEEKNSLGTAIGKAKAVCGFDIDAAVETNKYRQGVRRSINMMLEISSSTRMEKSDDYKFNVEGNQIRYFYDVRVEAVEAYNRDNAKAAMKEQITKADEVSRLIDTALINTPVRYDAPFDVNDSFEDAVAVFVAKRL